MRIIVHAGMHKTGTTSVQKWLVRNRDALEAVGIWARPLDSRLNAVNEEKFDPNALIDEIKKAKSEGISQIIFSSEIISTMTSKQFNRILDAFSGNSVKVVIALRHWSGFLPSKWGQNCSRRDSQSLPSFVKRVIDEESRIETRYNLVLDNLQITNGIESEVISYDRARKCGAVPSTVLKACEVPEEILRESDPDTLHVNAHETRISPEIVRLFNGAYAETRNEHFDELFEAQGPVRRPSRSLYDLGKRLISYQSSGPSKLWKEIEGIISETQVLEELSDNRFRDFINSIDRTIINYNLGNFPDNRIFESIDEMSFSCSNIEYYDLSDKIRAEMQSVVRDRRWTDIFVKFKRI